MRPRLALAAVLVLLSLAPGPASAGSRVQMLTFGSRYYPGDETMGSGPVVTEAPRPWLVIFAGDGIDLTNLDLQVAHSVTSDAFVPGTIDRLFDSKLQNYRETGAVAGVESLRPGLYPFHCILHDTMHGTLRVLRAPDRIG